MTNGTGRVETLRAHIHAVHDAAAAEYTERIIQGSQTLVGLFIATIRQEAVSLQQTSRADKLVRVPPEGRTGSRTASTENTLVQAIQFFPLFG